MARDVKEIAFATQVIAEAWRRHLAGEQPVLNWYFCELTLCGLVIERGWMLALSDIELIDHARLMGFGIDVTYLGPADMHCATPRVIDEEPEYTAYRVGLMDPRD